MRFLLYLNPLIAFAIIVVISVVVSYIGLKLVRRKYQHEYLKEHHEVAGIIFNAVELIYAVLVAFVVFATWASFDAAEKNIEMESNKLSDLFLDANAFPDSVKKEIRVGIADYTKAIVEEDWPAMQRQEKAPPQVIDKLRKVWTAYMKIDGRTINNPQMYSESVRQINNMSEFRRTRWLDSKKSTPEVIWLFLIVGAIFSVVFTFFLGSKHLKAQYVMTSVLAIINGMVLYLIYILDHPFVGVNSISDESFKTILNMFQHMLGG